MSERFAEADIETEFATLADIAPVGDAVERVAELETHGYLMKRDGKILAIFPQPTQSQQQGE